MGLSGRKVKQRIGADPRNLSWADDAARFGSNYLSKFGWDASKGLGAGGDGMKSHIKVSHKLDMLGIGAAQTKDPNGIAWKQNRDFENLLRRLNENMTEQSGAPAEGDDVIEATEAMADTEVESGEKKKKRKHEDKKDDELNSKKKKKKSEDKAENDTAVQMTSVIATSESVAVEVKRVVALPRHRAHRARAIAAKNIASKSSAHISEILGIAPESQPSYSAPSTQGKLTSVEDTDALGMDKLTTSTKSLADYFKEKLNARNGSSASSSGSSTPVSTNTSADDDMYERPRGGIGASRLHLEIQTETKIEEETQRVGLSKFSALMSSSFLAATSSFTLATPEHEEAIREKVDAHISDVESESDAKKRRKEEKKERKKDKKKHKHNKEEEEADIEEDKSGNKKSKKDKKGKGKATDETEAAHAIIIAASSSKQDSGDMDATEDDAEKISQKKAKTKHKSKGDSPPEEATKSKKEKKKHRKDS